MKPTASGTKNPLLMLAKLMSPIIEPAYNTFIIGYMLESTVLLQRAPEKLGARSTLLTIGPEEAQPPSKEAAVKTITSVP
jgi:hypothetical protein